MTSNNEEHRSQCAVVEFLRLKKVLFYAIPNGGSRNIIEARNLKAEGVTAGVPDLCICEPRGEFHGLYIEMKSKKGKLSKNQFDFIRSLVRNGFFAQVCYSVDEAISAIDFYLKIKENK